MATLELKVGEKYLNRNGKVRVIRSNDNMAYISPNASYDVHTLKGAHVCYCYSDGTAASDNNGDDLVSVFADVHDLTDTISTLESDLSRTLHMVDVYVDKILSTAWETAPEWANWLAMDKGGCWFWYSCKPWPAEGAINTFVIRSGVDSRGALVKSFTLPKKAWPKWKQSLQARPVKS